MVILIFFFSFLIVILSIRIIINKSTIKLRDDSAVDVGIYYTMLGYCTIITPLLKFFTFERTNDYTVLCSFPVREMDS